MQSVPDADPSPPSAPNGRGAKAELRAQVKARKAELRAQAQATKADIERGLDGARAHLDATNERIKARTGRNLILAILIGLALGTVTLFSLIVVKEIFMIFAIVLVLFASYEFASALRAGGRQVPRIPTVIAAMAVVPAAFYGGAAGQWVSILLGTLFVVLWRLVEQAVPSRRTPGPALLPDLGASVFVQIYVTFLASFAVVLVGQDGGEWWTLAFLIVVIAADTGAYASGLMFGKHPMAPVISPKKTWEGFAGGAVATIIAGVLLGLFMLGQPWWFGLIFGVAMLLSATLGDLAESLIKRDLGIKDMSSWLPGHGGFLDRLDSILPSAAVAFVLYLIFV
ncbi:MULTISPECIES: phosphatidate cytidylyltransferase [Microterricola]|uniref:Phosphatidate cytidylyltransferase n=1 Tax=Microterricola viridarii TaxID=412690 RepID=A0A1H1T8N3_9MICO|nr:MULTISPECIES: phosphatidate cytidylyltransferase [Microterricola]SDS56528.1 phosphatidate cytidylyltransferase [Microterricola viridarii]